MEITDGMFAIEKWDRDGIRFEQCRMAVLVDDGYGYEDLVTTAIVYQVADDGIGFAAHIESRRYFDSFGNERQAFLDDKLLHEYAKYMRASQKKIDRLGGRMSNDMCILLPKFLEFKMKFVPAINWELTYRLMDKLRSERNS